MKSRLLFIRLLVIALSVFLFFTAEIALSSFDVWQNVSDGLKDTNIKSIFFDKNDSLVGYIGSDRAVYKTTDGGKYWRQILSIAGQNTAVNFLTADSRNSNIIYAATANGLYRSSNEGEDWQKVFKGKNDEQRNCLSIALQQEKIYLGTQGGLFISQDKGKSWQKHTGQLSDPEISSIALFRDLIYLATCEGVFRSIDSGKYFQKVYSILASREANINQNGNGAVASSQKIHHIIIDALNNQKIYIASDKGVLVSIDSARSWRRLPTAGLTSTDINSIQLLAGKIFAGTDEGVFEFYGNRWQAVYRGLVANTVNFLCSDAENNLWAATDKGVYKISLQNNKVQPDSQIIITKKILDNFKDEPSIQQIQNQATKYAEVHPDKIKTWRRQAALAALMPSVSLNYDKTIYGSASTNTAESGDPKRYGTAMVGPRDWGLSLAWDISELVWNPDQTSIDSRSKLMVELRDDILDEVTRLYFERRRLQLEFLLTPPQDTKEKIEKELRITELTASIDALTGGYLSKMLQEG